MDNSNIRIPAKARKVNEVISAKKRSIQEMLNNPEFAAFVKKMASTEPSERRLTC